MVNMHNYEEYILLYADGELDEAGAAALQLFLKEHPELQQELDMYSQLKLVPDEALVFAGKEQLLKKEPKTIRLVPGWMYGAAASLALIVVVTLVVNQPPQQTKVSTVARIESKNKLNAIKPTPATIDSASAPTISSTVIVATAQPTTTTSLKANINNYKNASVTPANLPDPTTTKEPRDLAGVAPIGSSHLAPSQIVTNVVAAEDLDIPDTEMLAVNGPDESGSLENIMYKMHLDQEKKEGLGEVKSKVASGISKLQHLSKNLKETTVTLWVGKKEIASIDL